MRPGAIVFTVIPFGPTSRASVFIQPTTPGRSAFERARLSIGARTELDSMLTIRPRPLSLEVGQAEVSSAGSPRGGGARPRSRRRRRSTSGGRAGRWSAAVVDEDVDAAERADASARPASPGRSARSRRRGRRARRAAPPRARARRGAARTWRRSRPRRRAPRRRRAPCRRRLRRRSPSSRGARDPSAAA